MRRFIVILICLAAGRAFASSAEILERIAAYETSCITGTAAVQQSPLESQAMSTPAEDPEPIEDPNAAEIGALFVEMRDIVQAVDAETDNQKLIDLVTDYLFRKLIIAFERIYEK